MGTKIKSKKPEENGSEDSYGRKIEQGEEEKKVLRIKRNLPYHDFLFSIYEHRVLFYRFVRVFRQTIE